MFPIVRPEKNPARTNPAAVYLAGLTTEKSRRGMLSTINKLAELLSAGQASAGDIAWHQIRFEHVQAVKSKLLESMAPATVNKYLAALKGILRAAWQLGLMSAEEYQQAVSVRSVKSRTLPAGRELSKGELLSLLTACSQDPGARATRDGAIISLLYAGGLRRAELVGLDLADLGRHETDLASLRIRGKGHSERLLWLNDGALQALDAWLSCRGNQPGALFCRIRKGGEILPDRVTSRAVYNMLEERGKQAGGAKFSPHDFRRTFVSELLDAGADLSTVAALAGHANIQTTARYDRRGERAKQKAVRLLHVPFFPPKAM